MRFSFLVAAVLVSGCAFDASGGSAAGDGPVDAAPDARETERPPDAAPDPSDANVTPDARVPELLDTITVPATGGVIESTAVLAAGRRYLLVARGTVVIDDGVDADAEYFWFASLPRVVADGTLAVDIGLAVDDTDIDQDRQPRWGDFAGDHVYQASIEARGGTVEAQFHDISYGDNAGQLTLEIYAP